MSTSPIFNQEELQEMEIAAGLSDSPFPIEVGNNTDVSSLLCTEQMPVSPIETESSTETQSPEYLMIYECTCNNYFCFCFVDNKLPNV